MLKKRIAAMEQSASVLTSRSTREITTECVAQTLARFKQILAVEEPPMTQDEQIAAFKAGVRRLMDARQACNGN